MSDIPLEKWAANNQVKKRTAQHWASLGRIPARKKKMAKKIIKTWFGYVIDKDATPPNPGN